MDNICDLRCVSGTESFKTANCFCRNCKLYKLFCKHGFGGWWKDKYETMDRKEIASDLRNRKAPASPIFNSL